MTKPRFVQIHTLHSYPAALLNRDDSGLAKRMPFGGTTRTRVSSQCLKRHWRTADDEFSLLNIDGAEDVVRSRNIVNRRVLEGLAEEAGASENVMKPGFPILGVFRLNGQPKRDNGMIFGSCKATQSPVYPIRDAILAVNHASCPSFRLRSPANGVKAH